MNARRTKLTLTVFSYPEAKDGPAFGYQIEAQGGIVSTGEANTLSEAARASMVAYEEHVMQSWYPVCNG